MAGIGSASKVRDVFEIADHHIAQIRRSLQNGSPFRDASEELAFIFQRLGDPEGQALAREVLRATHADDCLEALEAALEMARHG
jgi:hypothetical protein